MLKVKYPQKTNKGKIHTTMNILTQKTNFRQSVILYSLRNSVFATIWRFSVFRATIYRWRKLYNGTANPLWKSQDVHTATPTNTQRKNSSSFPICVEEILTTVFSFGQNLCNVVILVPFLLFDIFWENLLYFPLNHQTLNIFLNLTSLCFIQDKESK